MNFIRYYLFVIGLILSCSYALILFFFGLKFGLSAINWHTHLMIYPIIWYIVYFVFKLDKSSRLLLHFTQILSILFCVEVALVLTGLNKTYLEKINGHYTSYYSSVNSYYHSWPPNELRCLERPESNYCYESNSLGFIDPEWEIKKEQNQIRVLALGDSFTEGDGAPYDSSYVAILRNKLKKKNEKYFVMNAGVCGSDPFNNFVNLRDRLLKYKPDIIIQTISSYDITADIAIRGGLNRYQKDGTVKHLKTPWWEPIYAISYLSRIIFHSLGYNHLFLKESFTTSQKEKLDNLVLDLFKVYIKLCKENKIDLILVLRPEKNEIFDKKYMYDFSTILRFFTTKKNSKVLDLLPKFQNYIQRKNDRLDNYFWRKDGHHNSNGYNMMAETIFEECFEKRVIH